MGQTFGNWAKIWKWSKILEMAQNFGNRQNSGCTAKFWILGKLCKIDTQGLPEAMGVPLKLDATHWFQIWPTSDLTSYPRYPTFITQIFNPVTIDDNDYKEWRLKHLWVQLWASSKNSKHPTFHCGGSLISKKVTKTIISVLCLQHVLTAYHCVTALDTDGSSITAVLGGICAIPPDTDPWKPKNGQKIKVKKGEDLHFILSSTG